MIFACVSSLTKKSEYLGFAFFIIFLFQAIRYNYGNDYKSYEEIFNFINSWEGLIGACENLCREYQPEVEFIIDISQEVEEIEEEKKLGFYRIIEQAVINSIKHGPASKVVISVRRTSKDELLLEIADDGPGAKTLKPGTGTIIVDAWTSKLGGRKEIKTAPGAGYSLKVSIPII
jgi:signal transduction histidine kinase